MWHKFVNFIKSVQFKRNQEKDLQSREERYRLIASVMSDYVFSTHFDQQGNIREGWIEGAFESMTGYTQQEYYQRGGWISILHPNDIEQDVWDMKQLRENKKVISEVRIVCKDGGIKWVRTYGHPLWDEKSNRLVGIYGAVQDITEQKQVEAAYLQSTHEMTLLYKMSLTLTSGQDLYNELRAFVQELKKIMIIDAFHIGFYDEQKDIFTYSLFLNEGDDLKLEPRSLKQSPGLTWEVLSKKQTLYLQDITNPKTQADYQIIIIRDVGIRSYIGIPLILEDKAIGVMSVQAKKVNAYHLEQIRLLETIAAQVVTTSEKSRLLTQLQSELAERKSLLNEMELKNAELERFSYTISHDLRSPLVTIRGFLGLIEKSAIRGDMESFQRDMQRIINATDRMNQLLRDLLELSRIGRVLNEKKETPFENLVYAAIENVQGRIQEKNIKIEISEKFPVVFVDQPRIIEVLQNLIDNAAKYMGDQKKPRIEIGWQEAEQKNQIQFYVKDNGIGIAPEHHEKIFGLFNKLDAQTEGTGVGLSLVRRIIEFHKGRIHVQSEAGKGSTFFFTLPHKPVT